jgi:hypothetical protein
LAHICHPAQIGHIRGTYVQVGAAGKRTPHKCPGNPSPLADVEQFLAVGATAAAVVEKYVWEIAP